MSYLPSSTNMSSTLIIPGLPDEVALCILARLPRILQARLSLVCHSWKDAMEPASLNTVRKMLSISGEVWPFFVDECMCIDNTIVFSVIVSPLPNFTQDIAPSHPQQQLKYIGVPPPPQLQQHCNSFEFEVLGVVGSEVLLTARSLHVYVEHFQGIYVFDAPSMHWRDCVHPYPNISNSKVRTAVDAEGGYIYVASGSYSIDHLDRLDVTRGMWEALPNPHSKRECAAVVILNGSLCVIGGFDAYVPGQERHALSSGEVWDPGSREWTLVSELWPADIFKGEMCARAAVVMDQLFALRGQFPKEELMHYQTSSRKWVSLGTLPTTDAQSAYETAYLCDSSLSGMGQELWVFDDCTARLATKPTLSQPVIWRVLSGIVQDTFQWYNYLKYIDVLLV